MKRIATFLTLALVTLLISGCGSAPIRPVASEEAAAAFGNITMPNNRVVTRVMLYKVGEVYAPPFKSPPNSHTYMNGNFFFENLEPGQYYLVGFMSGQEAFYFNYRGISEEEFLKDVAIDIKPGIVTYLGSYQVTGMEDNFFSADTFDIKPVRKPDSQTILNHLKEAAAGTGWDEKIGQQMR